MFARVVEVSTEVSMSVLDFVCSVRTAVLFSSRFCLNCADGIEFSVTRHAVACSCGLA